MSWIQWYLAGWLALTGFCYLVLDGTPKEGNWKFSNWFMDVLIFLPVYGRVFGWW